MSIDGLSGSKIVERSVGLYLSLLHLANVLLYREKRRAIDSGKKIWNWRPDPAFCNSGASKADGRWLFCPLKTSIDDS